MTLQFFAIVTMLHISLCSFILAKPSSPRYNVYHDNIITGMDQSRPYLFNQYGGESFGATLDHELQTHNRFATEEKAGSDQEEHDYMRYLTDPYEKDEDSGSTNLQDGGCLATETGIGNNIQWNKDDVFVELEKSDVPSGSTSRSIDSNGNPSIKSVLYRPRRLYQEFGSEYERELILKQWDLLPSDICNEAIALAEATVDMGLEEIEPVTVTSIMMRCLYQKGFDDRFISDFRDRRQAMSKTKTAVRIVTDRQRRMSKDLIDRRMHLIKIMRDNNVQLDGPIVDLERSTRDLHKGFGGKGYRKWYEAIVYYLAQFRKEEDVGKFRRLRSDYLKKAKTIPN